MGVDELRFYNLHTLIYTLLKKISWWWWLVLKFYYALTPRTFVH